MNLVRVCLSLLSLLLFAAFLLPLPSSYQIGRIEILIQKAVFEDGKEWTDPWLYLSKLDTPFARSIAEQALAEAQQILRVYPNNDAVLRLAGRAALLSGNTSVSLNAYTSAARLNSDSSTIWFELGLAYFTMIPDRTIETHLDDLANPDAHDTHVTVIRPEKEYYWFLRNSSESSDFWLGGEFLGRRVLVSDRVDLKVIPSDKANTLVFWISDPHSSQPVSYHVAINDEVVAEHHRSEGVAHWHPTLVSLSRWVGQEILISLSADRSIGWGDISLLPLDKANCEIISCHHRTIAAWQRGSFTLDDIISAGRRAFEQGKYRESLLWYERALNFLPRSSDLWYFIGRSFASLQDSDLALKSYQRAINLNTFSKVGLSSVYCYTAEVNRHGLHPPNHEAAWSLYNLAINLNEFGETREASYCHYKVGEIYWWSGYTDQSIIYFRKAIELDPNNPWAYLFLGKAYYRRDGDIPVAESYITQSISLYPDNPWAYFELGEIYREAGFLAKAKDMYAKALEVDENFDYARERIIELGQ